MGDDIFGAFDEPWKNTKPAEQGQSLDRVPPATYKFVCKEVDVNNSGTPVDHEVIDNRERNKSSGVKIFLEILEPAEVKNDKTGQMERTKGKVIEHVFWVTEKNLPFIMRDAKSILGKDLPAISAITKVHWAGKTVEGGVADEVYNGFTNSRVKFFNPWTPPAAKKTSGDAKPPTDAKAEAPAGAKKDEGGW